MGPRFPERYIRQCFLTKLLHQKESSLYPLYQRKVRGGAFRAKTCLTTWIISLKTSEIASQTSLEEILMVRGRPKIKSLPRISRNLPLSSIKAVPILIFISSAVWEPRLLFAIPTAQSLMGLPSSMAQNWAL